MDTIKLADVNKKGWKLKKEDQPHIRKVKADRAQAGVMASMVKSMEAQIEILDKLAERMDIVSAPLGKAPASSPPVINVAVQTDKTKKKFRCIPIRDEDGLMLRVDIEEV